MKTRLLFSTGIIFAAAIAFTLMTSCSHQPETTSNEVMVEFVSSHTAGIIPSSSNIEIRLAMPVEEPFTESEALPDELLTIKPSIAGKAYLLSRQVIRFIPDKPLTNGEEYQVSLKLKKLFPVLAIENQQINFSFQVIELDFKLGEMNMTPYNSETLQWNEVTGSITASDLIDSKSIEKWMTATLADKVLPVIWDKSSMPPTYRFTIDSVERIKIAQSLTITWDIPNAVRTIPPGTFEVPPLGEFNMMNITTEEEPEQVILVHFSDPLNSKQNMNGLVYFQDQSPVSIAIDKNTIRVTPKTHQTKDQVLIITSGIENRSGNKLGENAEMIVHFQAAPPEVRFTGKGNILPGENQWFVPFEVRNVTEVKITIQKIYTNNILQFLQVNNMNGDYEMNRVGKEIYTGNYVLPGAATENTWNYSAYALDLTKYIQTEPGAIYQIKLSYDRNHVVYPCVDEPDTYDGYYWENRNNPCKNAFYSDYYNDHFPLKNILASNLGVSVKNSGDSYRILVHNLMTTEPESGVKVGVYGYTQQLLVAATTDASGEAIVKIPVTDDPVFIMVEKNKQAAYINLNGGQSLSYSKFDTRGIRRQNGLQGFLYGERGVWRPGDTIFLTLIVEDKSGKLPDNHPATIELRNPKDKVVETKTVSTGKNGFYCFELTTSPEAETGMYYANARIGNASFSKSLRIENIKPNRLKVELNFPDSLLTSKNNKVEISSRWLSGGPASDFQAIIDASFKPQTTRFENYPRYHFDCPSRNFYPETKTVFDGKLDANGKATFNVELPDKKNATGMINVNFFSKVMERGGDFSVNQAQITYSPFETYVGIRTPEFPKGSDYLEVDTPVTFDVVTVNRKGLPVSAKNLEVSVYKLDWSWWYGSSGNSNLASYLNSHFNQRIYSEIINTPQGKGSFKLDLHYPAWGWYYAEISDPESGHSTGVRFYMDWPSYYNRDQREAPGDVSHLSMSTDKSSYLIGDTVNLTMDVPKNARLLVSIESGDTIIQSWQQTTTKKETVVSFVATDKMVPNVYASVVVIQPYSQTINDLPIRLYGLANVLVKNPESILTPVINSPESIRPNSDYVIKITEKQKRKMTYTIAVVDDGLLDLTNFKTPDPHSHFYAKEALSVRTWDDYDDVLGAFGGRILNTMAVGGDGSEEEDGNGEKKANRFKPVVTFIGPFTLEAGAVNEHRLYMPNYIGSVRCMVVAADKNAYGNAWKTITVKQPLMVLATVPRVLGPGETMEMPVSVFAMEDFIREAKVTVRTNNLLNIENASKTVAFTKPGEQLAWFKIKVGENQGIATIRVEVQSGKEKAMYDVEVGVRNPNPRVTVTEHHRLVPGSDSTYPVPAVGILNTRQLTMTVSGIYPMNLQRRLNYLSRYPYGCTEQVTSAAFPQLFLGRFMVLSDIQKDHISQNIMAAIGKLSFRQLASGGFVYWPGNNNIDDWITSYAGHFLFLARDQGYPVSQSLITNWISYQTKTANSWVAERKSDYIAGDASQAYRLYTLALAQKPSLSAMNRMAEMPGISHAALIHLAAAYAMAGQPEMGQKLLNKYNGSASNWRNAYYDWYGSETRDQSFQLMTYVMLKDQTKAFALFEQLAHTLGANDWLSTQSTAYALYAMSQFVGDQPLDAPTKYQYKRGNFKSDDFVLAKPVVIDTLDASSEQAVRVYNNGKKDLYVTFSGSGIPLPSKEILVEDNLKLEMKYFDMNHKPLHPDSLRQGKDFYLRAEVINSRLYGHVHNMALSVNLPSGWEIINTRLFDAGTDLKSSQFDYQDIRDDGIDYFFDLGSNQTKVFYILLHATYAGRWFMPASTSEAMYNNEIKAARGGGWVTVSKTK